MGNVVRMEIRVDGIEVISSNCFLINDMSYKACYMEP